nr:branched-chain amino acid aminotransferase [uncultured Bacillus sp.]
MLAKQVANYLDRIWNEHLTESSQVFEMEIFAEEKEYIEKHDLLSEEKQGVAWLEKEAQSRFQDAYLERCDKETDELLAIETVAFLERPIRYFKEHVEEFIYVESPWFEMINVDAVSFEADSVFGTYDVMLGLKLPKKKEGHIISYLTNSFTNAECTFDLMFNNQDGLWDLNFPLNRMKGFTEDWTINEAYCAIYNYLFLLAEAVEEKSL